MSKSRHSDAPASPCVCKKCGADLTLPDSVSRRYDNKDDGDSPEFGTGHYDPKDGCFEPGSRLPRLSGGRYDLNHDSDSCASCDAPL